MGRAKPAAWHCHTLQTQQDKSHRLGHKWLPCSNSSCGPSGMLRAHPSPGLGVLPACRVREKLPGLGLSPRLPSLCLTQGVKICHDSTTSLSLTCLCTSWRHTAPGCSFGSSKANLLWAVPTPDHPPPLGFPYIHRVNPGVGRSKQPTLEAETTVPTRGRSCDVQGEEIKEIWNPALCGWGLWKQW